ncbi:cyoE [Wigglesworthia glossinidia endosymbiont of Glossina brevipalpis]|uniref:Protoheme IX farnesyltransferase n=1 Tax=Wigglesworthia glossinidia brevipalpis TaxID=36870 RepID=CYOE_WIGBR|nr:RecName: Full=Protoheme IX farnesyltransferase; AltName: Full=Heme B farnesyltransferase; AltName: Full=Heme O synthase [Wigglesworthia glossinidia endosymbiont of Glossina brevipalpis]BAC24297.1 cyoE [Wigglesworthia glossinidia endosymbiont of Glossina brevipalpis]
MIIKFIQIIKPGIIFGNIISTIGGFLLASQGDINVNLFIFTISATAILIASASIFNNCIDKDIDIKMQRTKNRAIAIGLISSNIAYIYALILLILSFLLFLKTNFLTIFISMLGFFIYVFIYSLLMKRKSVYSTIIGSLSGATPPIIGYCSVKEHFDIGAFILLCIFSFWQIPHSYAIGLVRYNDYKIASIPIFPIKKGSFKTKINIIIYIIAFFISTIMLFFAGYTGNNYLFFSIFFGLIWIFIAIKGFKSSEENFNIIWGRKIFLFSIVIITAISILISIDYKKNI